MVEFLVALDFQLFFLVQVCADRLEQVVSGLQLVQLHSLVFQINGELLGVRFGLHQLRQVLLQRLDPLRQFIFDAAIRGPTSA